jgi:hypothetical protein
VARRAVISLPAASGELLSGNGCVLAYAARESTGAAAAAFSLIDGSSDSGRLLLPVGLSASASSNGGFVHCAVPFRQSLWFNLDSGAVVGAVVVLLAHDCEAHWALFEQRLQALATTPT